ncbi:hypothetical protein K438DRAFT_1769248 [Mycena galopus ATCC 62051]|nr:hypothetical protein K438DRAFT_1769248 [Mycena galopus ATCC 62051]
MMQSASKFRDLRSSGERKYISPERGPELHSPASLDAQEKKKSCRTLGGPNCAIALLTPGFEDIWMWESIIIMDGRIQFSSWRPPEGGSSVPTGTESTIRQNARTGRKFSLTEFQTILMYEHPNDYGVLDLKIEGRQDAIDTIRNLYAPRHHKVFQLVPPDFFRDHKYRRSNTDAQWGYAYALTMARDDYAIHKEIELLSSSRPLRGGDSVIGPGGFYYCYMGGVNNGSGLGITSVLETLRGPTIGRRHHTLDNLANERGVPYCRSTCRRVCGARMRFQMAERLEHDGSCASGGVVHGVGIYLELRETSRNVNEAKSRVELKQADTTGCPWWSSWQRLSFREVEAVVHTATRQTMGKAAKTRGIFYFGAILLAQYLEGGEVSDESQDSKAAVALVVEPSCTAGRAGWRDYRFKAP